jgi:hypothetical protein
MGNQEEKRKGVGRPKVKEKRKPRSIKATEDEWRSILKLLEQIESPKAVAIITALESYLENNSSLSFSGKGTDPIGTNSHCDDQVADGK